jgi:hypothetical protein
MFTCLVSIFECNRQHRKSMFYSETEGVVVVVIVWKLCVRIPPRRTVLDATLCDQVCQVLPVLQFPPPIKLTAITELYLKVALNIITLSLLTRNKRWHRTLEYYKQWNEMSKWRLLLLLYAVVVVNTSGRNFNLWPKISIKCIFRKYQMYPYDLNKTKQFNTSIYTGKKCRLL